jgi:menaquinone-dependent protoporphyrinogen oxidase
MTMLVSYATQHGSTREIAERICARLRDTGLNVEIHPFDQVGDLGGYDAFVLGSAIHNQAWLPQATQLAERHRDNLVDQPVWLFSVGMPSALRGAWKRFAIKEEAKVSAGLRQSLRPRGHRLFDGVFRPDHVPAFGRFIFRMMGGRYGDYRNWDAIDSWADEIAHELTGIPHL